MTDRELLGAYARDGDQAAFGELVRRHIDLVYNACVRQARGNRHLAEDATQAVFLLLAQRAGRIGANVVLPGWLYQTARHAAANAVRAEDRRRRHERAAAQIMPLTTPTQHDDPPAWERAAPILDDAINALSVHDRDAVLLRYFQGKGVREMAVALGVSEDAAKQRVSRAVERLRRAFARRGVSLTGAAALVVILETANAQAAPPALISAASALGSASAATAIAGPVSAIAKGVLMMSHLKTLAATFAVVVLVGLGGAAAALLRGAPPPSTPKPAAAAPVVPVAAPAASPYHIAYANGVTVDFLAVSVVPSRLQPFWYPDGSRGVEPPYESRGPGPGYMRAGGKSVYELTARISGAAAAGDDSPPYLRTRAINGITIAVAASPFKGAATLGDLRVFECSVGAGDETLKFGLGIAANTWQPVRTFKTPGVYGSGPDKVEVIELSPRDRPSRNGSWFRAQLAPSEDALRLVAIDESGKAHVSRGGWIMAGAWHGVEAVFPGLAREKVREFRIERCAFEWQAVKDVHLKPAGDLASVLAQARVKRLIGDELRCKPEDARKVDAAIETLGRLNLDDVDAWGGAVRDLADVGAAAVPAICAELQRTSRPYTRSALAVALRAIDDPRAVPALAAALADCPFSPNDYGGLRVKDPAILHFMLGLQRDPGYAGPGDPTINFGRPVNEITAALEQLSGGHSEGFAPARKDDRKVFQDTAHRWQTWWDQNGGKFTAGLPMLRIGADPNGKLVEPALPDDLHIADVLRANPALAREPVLDRWTRLHVAVARGRINAVEALVSAGADVNAAGWGGWTPLHLAAALGQEETVEFLVSQRADVRSKTVDGCTPLHAASGACVPPTCRPLPPPDPAIVKFLLDKGADPKAADARGRTALHGLVARGEGALVRSLLDRGAEVNAKDQRGRTPLHRAVECGNESAVDALLAAHADVNATDATGRTPIRLAPYSLSYTTYNPPMVKKLLDHGAQVDLVTTIALGSVEQVAAAIERDPKAVNQKGKTQDERLPLHWAVSRKSPEMVKLLLDHGADPNAKEKDGNPPLHGAVFAQNPQVVSMLIAAKADVNALGQGDCTALYWACNNLDVEVVNLLLAAGADPNTKAARQPNPLSAVLQSAREGRFGFAQKSTPAERSALAKTLINALLDHKADPNGPVWGGGYSPIFGADEEQAELLLSRGARLDVTTEDGNTLLHYAAILSRGDLARFAIKHKLSLEAKNKKGETPLHCAVGYLRPSEAVVEMILAANPDLGAKDNEGRSPLHRAVIIGSVPAATALLNHQADPEARDNEGATPLHHAAKLGRDNMVALLIDRGAAVNVRDKAGRTPLDWATRETTRALLVEHGATGK